MDDNLPMNPTPDAQPNNVVPAAVEGMQEPAQVQPVQPHIPVNPAPVAQSQMPEKQVHATLTDAQVLNPIPVDLPKGEGEEKDIPMRISIVLPTNAYFVSGIRDFTLEMVKNMTGFSEQWAFRFQSVVDELCNNAIEHGSSKLADVRVTFISKQNEYLEIFVEDTGTGPNKLSPQELTSLIKQRQQMDPIERMKSMRGRGLPQIVANWTDELIVKQSELGGICVHIIKKLSPNAMGNTPSSGNSSGSSSQQQIYKI